MEFGEGKVQTIFKVEEEQNNPSVSNNEEKNEKKIIMPNRDVKTVN